MKFSNLNRIYFKPALVENDNIKLSGEQMHYIKTVLRLRVNDRFRIFNGINGEFIAQIREIIKNNLLVDIKDHLRINDIVAPLTLGISIVKPEKLLLAVNMAVQLGVTQIVPLITERCQFKNVKEERLLKCIIEATEQSERLNPPMIRPAIKLQDYLAANTSSLLIYANEYEDQVNSIFKVFSSGIRNLYSDIAFIVGPEGGFTDNELKNFSTYQNAQSISLGTYILRAETAVAAGLAQILMLNVSPN